MRRDYAFLHLAVIALLLGGMLACGIGTVTPTDAPQETPVDTPTQAAANTPTPEPTDTPMPPSALELKAATFAHGLDDEMRPVDAGDEFTPDETVYLSLTLSGRPKEGEVAARFYWRDESIAEADADLADVNSGVIFSVGEDTYVGYTLTHDEPFPISEAYRADVFYDDEFLDSFPFHVGPPADAVPSQVLEVTLARGADSDYNPIDETTTFAPEEEVYIVGRADLGLYTWLQAEWYVDGELDEAGTRSITAEEDASDVGFFFSFVPEEGWPVGDHQVLLIMNDEEVDRYDFTVEEAPTVSLVPFEDPTGVFSLSYPDHFDEIEEGTEGYSYTFFDSDGSGGIYIYFDSLDAAFSDNEWQLFADNYSVAGMPGFGEDAVEFDRQLGEPGVHALYLEVESEKENIHGLVWVEEVEAAVAVAVWASPIDLWPEQQAGLFESLDSFVWSPEAVQAAAPPPQPTSTPVPATPTPLPPPTPTSPPPPPSSWWPGQPDVPPGKACFLVASSVNGEVTFNLGPQTQKIPPNGHVWFVMDPGHVTWTADLPDGRRGGGELDIQPGCEPFVNALSLSG
ncbi:MAG: hypothetical protein JSV81_15790 [Anaerolineales bacterium]|nr:MAG: hypothetical protein JSV81_15790 [Anaerolineales bacterium]